MSAIFVMFKKCLHEHMVIYWNLTQNITKGQRWVEKGQKRVQKPQKKDQTGTKIGPKW